MNKNFRICFRYKLISRITSYNVCYTKLLRHEDDFLPVGNAEFTPRGEDLTVVVSRIVEGVQNEGEHIRNNFV